MITNNIDILDMQDPEKNKEVVEYLANSLCNKTIRYGQDEYRRTVEYICVPTSAVEAIHEIARWMCSEDQDEVRLNSYYNFTRLGNVDIPDAEKKYAEESVALCLTKLLVDNFLIEPSRREQQYAEYLFEQHRWLAETFGKQDSIQQAQNIYNKFLANI